MTVYFKVDDCLFLNRQKFFIVYLLCICARYLFFVQISSFVPIRPLSFCLFFVMVCEMERELRCHWKFFEKWKSFLTQCRYPS